MLLDSGLFSKGTSRVALLVVIEGIDGSGKGTQSARLRDRLLVRGLKASLLSFPRYDATFFGQRIGDFLNGRFGQLNEVDPFLASLLYAGDRLESKAELTRLLESCDILVLDRYVPSNIAHQAGKRTGAQRRELADWIEKIEYELFGLPRPDLVVLLDIPAKNSQELIAKKDQRTYTTQAADMQEADTDYLSRVRSAYRELAAERGWSIVSVVNEQGIRSMEELTAELEQLVDRALQSQAASPPAKRPG
jgi:dTMP kinase